MSINLLLTPGTNITKNDNIQTNGSKKNRRKGMSSIDETILVNVEDAVLSSGEIVAVET